MEERSPAAAASEEEEEAEDWAMSTPSSSSSASFSTATAAKLAGGARKPSPSPPPRVERVRELLVVQLGRQPPSPPAPKHPARGSDCARAGRVDAGAAEALLGPWERHVEAEAGGGRSRDGKWVWANHTRWLAVAIGGRRWFRPPPPLSLRTERQRLPEADNPRAFRVGAPRSGRGRPSS